MEAGNQEEVLDHMRPDTNLSVIGIEVVGLGAFVLILAYLEVSETKGNPTVVGFAWVFGIVAISLILVGLETLSVVRKVKPSLQTTRQD